MTMVQLSITSTRKNETTVLLFGGDIAGTGSEGATSYLPSTTNFLKSTIRMMRKVLLLLVVATFAWVAPTNAQNASDQDVVRCYTMEADAQLRTMNPKLGSLDDFERWLAPFVEQYKAEQAAATNRVNAVTTIPIIFHVIHNGQSVGTGDNLSATYINAQITQLNNDFRRISGTSGHNTNSVGADTEVEFCAATVNPSNVTLTEPGINRINRSSMGWSAPPYGTCSGNNFNDAYIEGTIKPQSQWDPNKYLNIWVMDMTCGILGYAQFPSNSGLSGLSSNGGSANTDGVVILPSSVGSTTTPNPSGGAYNKGRTLTHEIGHWIGLRHIWGDGGCSVDDYCGDTPASDAANFGCPTSHVSCSSTDMVQNYMDYTDDNCMNIFTQDQKARMQAVLANSPRRNTLGASTGCGGSSGGNCTSTISSFPYSEGFESSWGGWTQGSGDDFDWSRLSGSTASSNTGPSSAASGSYYAYTESSSPNYPSKRSYLNGPCFDLSSASNASFGFQYHMYGAAMGTLSLDVSTDNGSTWNSAWSASGDKGNSWLTASVNLNSYAGNTIKLRFNGLTSNSYTSDMSVDNLSLTTSTSGGGSCTGGITSFPYSEGFESSFGLWTQGTGDDFNWSRNSGSTPSSNTGPASAAAGSYYAYMEASSPNYPSKSTYLNSPCFNLSSASSATFTFQYHMYGAAGMGALLLQASTNNGSSWSTVWSRSGNQGNSWQSGSADLAAYTGSSMQLRFVASTGNTWQGDIAVDDVSLSTGGSGGGCSTVNITLTFDDYPEETSWEILDGSTVVASGGTYGSQADGSTLLLNECLDAGCYDFVIYDAYGDGICCAYGNGSYLVTSGGSTLASGGSFTSSENTPFCVSGSSRDAEAEAAFSSAKGLNLFPNPTTSTINYTYESKVDTEAMLRIADMTGRIVHQVPVMINAGMNQQGIDVQQLPAGTYMLSISHTNALISKRFVVVK